MVCRYRQGLQWDGGSWFVTVGRDCSGIRTCCLLLWLSDVRLSAYQLFIYLSSALCITYPSYMPLSAGQLFRPCPIFGAATGLCCCVCV